MNQKVLVALTIIAVVLGILNLTLLLIPNIQNYIFSSQSTLPVAGQKMPLEFGMTINNSSGYYPIQFVAILPYEIPTLFNCHVKLDYLTESGVWKTTSKDIGLVDCKYSGDMRKVSLTLDSDFDSGGVPISQDAYYQSVNNPSQMNIKVEAYGYLKP